MTRKDEERIMKQYEGMLWGIVWRFKRRCSFSRLEVEDLMQEAREAFLGHIRTHDEAEYGRCHRTITHALMDALRRDYGIYVPWRAIKRECRKMRMVELTEWREERMEPKAADVMTDVDTAIDMAAKLEKMDETTRKIIRFKAGGMTNREAGRMMGKTDVQVHRMLKRARGYLLDDGA